MNRLEAELIKAALIWHAVTAIKGRPLHSKEEQALRRAAIRFLKLQDDKKSAKRLEVALKRKVVSVAS